MEKGKLDTKKILLIGVPVILLLLLLVIIKNGQGEGDIAQQQTEEAFLPESEEEKVLSKREAYEKERREKEMEAQLANVTYSDNDFFSDMMNEEDKSDNFFSQVAEDVESVKAEREAGTTATSTTVRKSSSATTSGRSSSTGSSKSSGKSSSSSANSDDYSFSYDDVERKVIDKRMQEINKMRDEREAAKKATESSKQTSATVSSIKSESGEKDASVTSNNSGSRSRTSSVKAQVSKNLIRACIHGDQIVTSGGTVRMRLLEDLHLDNVTIPASSIFYGVAQISGERMKISVKTIKNASYIANVDMEIYDNDAIEGLNLPDNIKAQISKQASSQNVSNGIDVSSIARNSNPVSQVVNGTVGTVVNAVKSIGANRINEIKVNLKSNYQIYIR